MNNTYNKILNAINKEVKIAIKEQFNISDIDFSDDTDYYNNIFNKEYVHPYLSKILDGTITKKEIKELNKLYAIIKPASKEELLNIIDFYSDNYPKESMNCIDVSNITDMEKLFYA